MTAAVQTTAIDPAVISSAADVSADRQAQGVVLQAAALMLALLVPTVLGALLDARLTDGVNGWLKPIKFELSLAVHYATLAILLGLIAPAVRAGRLIRWSMLAAAFLGVLEVAYIMLQAGRARASHFNAATRFEEVAYMLMGIGAVSIVAVTFIAGLMLWRHPRAGVSAAMRLGAGGGLMLSGLATLLIAGYLSQRGAHWVGTPSLPGGLPLAGWSTRGGDLRVSHFFATHAAQAVPLFALAWERLRPHDSSRPVAAFLVLYTAFTAAVVVQALMGMPFLG